MFYLLTLAVHFIDINMKYTCLFTEENQFLMKLFMRRKNASDSLILPDKKNPLPKIFKWSKK